MAAPKRWGYSREQEIPDELLVAWADGDIIKILDKEIVERQLTDAAEREELAAFARAAQDTVEPTDGRNRLERPRPGLTELCRRLGHEADLDPAPHVAGPELRVAGRSVALPAIPVGTVLRAGLALAVSGLLILWMVRNL